MKKICAVRSVDKSFEIDADRYGYGLDDCGYPDHDGKIVFYKGKELVAEYPFRYILGVQIITIGKIEE